MTKLSSAPLQGPQQPQPHVRAIKPPPLLAVKPPIMGISFLDDASANASSVRSFFSPCSSDEESSDGEEDQEPRNPRPGKTKVGKYRRMWAKQPPKTPFPFGLRPASTEESAAPENGEAQSPPLHRRPSLASPTFGNTSAHNTTAPSTAAGTPALRPCETEPWSATSVPPFAPTPPVWQSGFCVSTPQTPAGPAPIPNARSDGAASLLAHDAELLAAQTRLFQTRVSYPITPSEHLSILQALLAENEKAYLNALHGMYSSTLSTLLKPNAIKEKRDRLIVQTQKAHLRRAGASEVASLHRQLSAAEEEMSQFEQGILAQRLESELGALEKRAKGELEVIMRLRRNIGGEESSSEDDDESEPETEYHVPSEQPLASPKPELTPLPPLSPDEEIFLAAISRSRPLDEKPVKAHRTSLPPIITNSASIRVGPASPPPQRPLFSPRLPAEFKSLPQLMTTSPSPTTAGSALNRRATLGSPLSSSVTSAETSSESANRSSLPAAPSEISIDVAPEPKVEKLRVSPPSVELAPGEKAPEEPEEGSDDLGHGPQDEKVGEKGKTDELGEQDIALGSPVLCQRVNGVEMVMI